MVTLNSKQVSTILVALRQLQNSPFDMVDMNGILDNEEIDNLCELINFGDASAQGSNMDSLALEIID